MHCFIKLFLGGYKDKHEQYRYQYFFFNNVEEGRKKVKNLIKNEFIDDEDEDIKTLEEKINIQLSIFDLTIKEVPYYKLSNLYKYHGFKLIYQEFTPVNS